MLVQTIFNSRYKFEEEGEISMETKKLGSSVLIGVGVIYVIAASFALLFSLLLLFTSLEEQDLYLITTIISFIAIFIGGFMAGGKGKERGWLLGGLTGLTFTIINFLVQYLGFDQTFSSEQIIIYICFNVTSIMGGILGVNMAGGSNQSKG